MNHHQRMAHIKWSRRPPFEERFWAQVNRLSESECWAWIGKQNAKGYGQVSRNGTRTAHRVAWILEHGIEPDPSLEVAHSCHNRLCVNPAHLSLKTHSANMLDSARAGRLTLQLNPEKTNLRKLTRDQVVEIRQSILTTTELADKFSVTPDNIRRILKRETWTHI